MQIIDIVKTPDSHALYLFNGELELIKKNESFALKRNYENINLDHFHSFTLLISDEGDLVAFSGLQSAGPWHTSVARIGSKYRIAKKYQTVGLLGRTYDRSLLSGSRYMLPYQLSVAIDRNLSGVFFSREGQQNRNHLKAMADKCNQFESRIEYQVYPKMVNVCRLVNGRDRNDSASCWQNAVIGRLTSDFELGLPECDTSDLHSYIGNN